MPLEWFTEIHRLVERIPDVENDVQRDTDIGRYHVLLEHKNKISLPALPFWTLAYLRTITHPRFEWLLSNCRVSLRDKHQEA